MRVKPKRPSTCKHAPDSDNLSIDDKGTSAAYDHPSGNYDDYCTSTVNRDG